MSSKNKGNKVNLGRNVHSYSTQIKNISKKIFISSKYNKALPEEEWKFLIEDISRVLETKKKPKAEAALANIRKLCLNGKGYIHDKDVPNTNAAVILKELWSFIKMKLYHPSLLLTSLEEINSTCVQGVTHRIICEYIAARGDILFHVLKDMGFSNRNVNHILKFLR